MPHELCQINIFPCLYYDDAKTAIDWLSKAFGFKKRLVVPGLDGSIVHAELSLGSGVIMVGSAKPAQGKLSPKNLPAIHQSLCVRIDNPDEHYITAKAAGAKITRELQDEDYGSRGYMVKDIEGHHWYFGTYQPDAYWENDISTQDQE